MKKSILLVICFLQLHTSKVSAQCTNLSVPYFEGFSSITTDNQLPTCWAASNMSTTCVTFTNAGKYAGFYYTPGGQNYFYSPGLYLKAGNIYSVSCWHKIVPSNNSGWTNFSILMGPSQSTTGLQTIVNNSFPSAISFSPLSGTLTVSTSGNYYFAIGVTSSGGGTSSHLMWDDFMVEIPCSLNMPGISVVATPSAVCEGDTVTYTATGADTYTWCGGATGSSIQLVASFNMWNCTGDIVTGTDSLSGCQDQANTPLSLLPRPSVSALANPAVICKGKISNVQAFGASSFTWNFGAAAAQATVAPATTTQYIATGVNQFGCWANATVNVTVNQLPVLDIPNVPAINCSHESLTLTAMGATSFTWTIFGQQYFSNPVQFIVPVNTAIIYLTGMDGSGCVNTHTAALNVSPCQNVLKESSEGNVHLFPNPSAGTFYVQSTGGNPEIRLLNGIGKELHVPVVSDAAGRFMVDLKEQPDGLYILLFNGQPLRLLKGSQ